MKSQISFWERTIEKVVDFLHVSPRCPNCDVEWEEDENIFRYFRKQYPQKDISQLRDWSNGYGHALFKPKYFGKNVVYMEFDLYDGALAKKCLCCDKMYGVYSGLEITDEHTIQKENSMRQYSYKR